MEEILASIKRVIADDNRTAAAQRGPKPRKTDTVADEDAPHDEDDVLELHEPIPEEPLVSPDSAAATRQSLAQLAALRQQGSPDDPADQGPLEAVVRDMLKPLLKQWLDERLPDMIEDMVAREIARITGKRF